MAMESVQSGNASGLSSRELTVLRERLERMRDELLARLQREEAVATEGESLPEPADAAEQTIEQDDAVRTAERDRASLSEIERALRKFEDGSYGVSEVSGEPIGFRRLEILPWARETADEAESR